MQDEKNSFSKICYIPGLKLSCFGCCGHHFAGKRALHSFFAKNKRELKKYLESGKTHKDFMNREPLLSTCGACYSLIRDKGMYVCAVHPNRIGRPDIRVKHCDYDYLCKGASFVNNLDEGERKLFYQFLKAKKFDSFDYSIINSQETVIILMYFQWKERKERKI